MADAITSTRGANVASNEELNRQIDALRDALVESGQVDATTADALLFAVRPPEEQVVGNLADLHRMGQIQGMGRIVTAPGQDDVQASGIEAAFEHTNPPDQVSGADIDPGTGRPRVENQGDPGDGETPPAEANPESTTEPATEPTEQAQPDTQPVSDSMTKAELLAEAENRGVQADDSMTKADIIAAINNG